MVKEIERKFLVRSDAYRELTVKKNYLKQAYLSFDPVVRVRIADEKSFLTIKSKGDEEGLVRHEWEWTIDRKDAEEMMRMHKGNLIEKIRYFIPWKDVMIEVDEFIRPRRGLVLAEVELKDVSQTVELPEWLGEEVTGKAEYYNAYMAKHG